MIFKRKERELAEIDLMSLQDDLIITKDDKRYCIDEYIEKLQKENKHLKDLQQNMDKQYEKLENNWNELKKWLEEEKGQWGKNNSCWFESVLDKMQELEGNNEKRRKENR